MLASIRYTHFYFLVKCINSHSWKRAFIQREALLMLVASLTRIQLAVIALWASLGVGNRYIESTL